MDIDENLPYFVDDEIIIDQRHLYSRQSSKSHLSGSIVYSESEEIYFLEID